MENKIVFDLTLPVEQKELDLRLLEAKGYIRDNIKTCFEELEAKGFGIYKRGGLGRGNVAKFYPNDDCPKQYTILVELKKTGRIKKLIKE